MSRAYEMLVEIGGYEPERVESIKAAANGEWPFDDWHEEEIPGYGHRLSAYAQSQLCGGETEEEFAERLAIAIWQVNGGCCCVSVHATYLDDLPFETHVLDEEEYERWKGEEP